MNHWFSALFTIGGILGFITMLGQSIYTADTIDEPVFIFAGGSVLALLLEVTLVHLFNAYGYTNLPLTVFAIPLVIPLGWVVTFYGLMHIAQDILEMAQVDTKERKQSGTYDIILSCLTGILAVLYGLAIEIIARSSQFWEFNFVSVEIIGVPIIVSLAWGLAVAVFTGGVRLYRHYPNFWIAILLLVHGLNTVFGYLLLQLVEFT